MRTRGKQVLFTVSQGATVIAAGGRTTLSLSLPSMPIIVAGERDPFRIWNVTGNISANAAADSRQISLDAADISVAFFAGATFLASMALTATGALATGLVTFSEGPTLLATGLPLIAFFSNMGIGAGGAPTSIVITFAADMHNIDGAAAHSFTAFTAALVELQ